MRASKNAGDFGLGKRHNTASTTEAPYTDDEREFLAAMESYKEKSGNRFPQWSVVLAVLRSLGYRKVKTVKVADVPQATRRTSPSRWEMHSQREGLDFQASRPEVPRESGPGA